MTASPEEPTFAAPSGDVTHRVWFAQALRGVAALIVVLEHLTQDFINAQPVVSALAFTRPITSLPAPPLREIPQRLALYSISPGIFAVGLFFLISGFVIPFSLERRTLGGFVVRRFFRLYPTLWACMALTTAAVVVLSGHHGFPYSGATLATNAVLVPTYAGKGFVDPVYWTLVIEELFYVCAAVMASRGLLHRRATLVALAGGLAAMAMWIGNPRTPTPAHPEVVDHYVLRFHLGFNSTFVLFILIGVVLHQHYRRVWGTLDCVALGAGLLGLFYACLHHGPFKGNEPAVFFACAVAALVVVLVLYVLRDRVPYSRTADRLAEISYPLYLIHTIVGWVMLAALTRATGQFYVALAITFPTVVLVAVAVHHFVEKPSMRLGRRIAGAPRFRRKDRELPAPEPAVG
ncbi:MAG: acyltransferase [Actinomycetota bacterium]|nr:acyltransferase [Actinomycetota bacterium]